jgi:peptide/nickel transport system permease protein
VTVFIIRRLLQAVFVVVLMTVIVFFGIMVIGNPADILISEDCVGECYVQAVRFLGLDRPIYEQYFVFVKNVLQGDLGNSFKYGISALDVILERMPATLELAFFAMFITVVVGIPLGMWAGLRPESFSGRMIMGGSILGFSLPNFWVGIMLILFFAVDLGWLPASGRGDTVDVLGLDFSFLTLDGLAHLTLPAVALSLFFTALVIRLTRAGMRETLLLDYVKFAHAKGLSRARVMFVHVLKNILLPVVTVLGLELGGLIAFAVVTETIFAWPGMGKLLIDSIDNLDRPVVVGYLMITVFMFIIINLVVDLLYSVIDPRVRLHGIKA